MGACQDLFAAAVSGLTLTTHADFQAEILLIIRDILVWFESVNQAPEQLLLSLPNITPDVFQSFKLSMKNNPAEKDQRNLVRKLLLRSGAHNSHAQIADAQLDPAVTVGRLPRCGQGSRSW